MSDRPPEQPPLPPSDPEPTQTVPADQGAPRARWQHRVWQRVRTQAWTWRSVIAVALASVILGGLGGAALAGFADDDDDGRRGPGQDRFGRGPGGDDRQGRGFDRRGQGKRQWGRDGQPDQQEQQPAPTPSPTVPSPTT